MSPLASEGRATYMSVCIACHNADPAKEGGLGPAIAGSSAKAALREDLEQFVDYAESEVTAAADEIEALHAYLNELAGSG